MDKMDIQQNSEDTPSPCSYLDFPHPSGFNCRIPIKARMKQSFKSLQCKEFTTEYPFAKKEDWALPEPPDYHFKTLLLLFLSITILIPLLLIFMPLGVLLEYSEYLRCKRKRRKEFIGHKASYLRGER